MNVDAWSSSTLSVEVEGYTGPIPVHYLRLVARPLPVRGCHFHRQGAQKIVGGGGRLMMTGKASEPL